MTNFRIIIVLAFLTFISCQKDNFIVLKQNNDTIEIKRIVLNRHKNPKGYVENFYLELKDYSKIKKEFISEFQLFINDSVYSAQGIKFAFSRDEIIKDFYFTYDNHTNLINLDTVDNAEMFSIGPGKRNFNNMNWVKTELVID
ncbi:hypothetical protein [Flavobacterium urocaniciphilum]|uniref:hypothetical protein n=1 Tax=Flavobacterium urocaniciphilum TaxID=1299341 RepID=UPI000B81F5A7|nr:hypothetical protein [Flavobacterium urocaniciphilum]